ncbi:MAG: potassium transporter TrkG [Chloroflexota bacterium]|nr:potassium transporter TrkG [Chloroflexota bacterium]
MKDRQRRNPVDLILKASRSRPWQVNLPSPLPTPKSGAVSPLLIIYGFATVIALGTLLLWLPISSATGDFTSPVDALFTAASAVCVTGLVVVDTGTYYSTFGQGVILALIQIGGLGIMTCAAILLWAFGRRIGIRQRLLMSETLGGGGLGGVVELIKRITIFALVFEILGAVLFYIRFSSDESISPATAAWRSVFQSVSAFNNAGFDIFGEFRSLMDYQDDALVLLVTSALVILGSISFIVFSDVVRVRRFVRLTLDTQMVLITTVALLAVGMIVILITEFSNDETIGGMLLHEKLVNAFFLSCMRTAGFSSINMGSVANYALFFIVLLMFIGGAAGSAAGGIKVNTFGMLIATTWSSIRGIEHAGAFGREFKPQQINQALALVMLSIGFAGLVVLVLTMIEDFPFINLLFETVSACGTVGFSTGITPELSTLGKLIVVVTMFIGRLGPLALALSFIQRQRTTTYRHPQDMVRIG